MTCEYAQPRISEPATTQTVEVAETEGVDDVLEQLWDLHVQDLGNDNGEGECSNDADE